MRTFFMGPRFYAAVEIARSRELGERPLVLIIHETARAGLPSRPGNSTLRRYGIAAVESIGQRASIIQRLQRGARNQWRSAFAQVMHTKLCPDSLCGLAPHVNRLSFSASSILVRPEPR